MSARDLIKQFQSEGDLEKRGEFQVDREKAREKMQKFQLPDPHAYVLELVKFATIQGATKIHFEIDADEMRMTCDCKALTVDDLENLYGAAFSRLKSDRQRALRHLAIGLTAADALNPKVVILRSTGEEGGGAFEARGGEEEIVELEPGTRHTEIYLREKFKAGHLTEFFSSLAGSLAEHHHLRTRCRYAEVDIRLGQEQLSFGINSDASYQRVIDTPHEKGLMWLLDSSILDSTVEILQDGVLISTRYLSGDGAPFHAVVESSRLTTDLTQSAFVEDAAFNQVMNVLLVRVHDQLLTRKFMDLPVGQWGREHETVEMLAAELVKVIGRAKSLGVSTHETRLQLAEKLEQYPLLPLASSPETIPPSMRVTRIGQDYLVPISSLRGQNALHVSYRRMLNIVLPNKPVVLHVGAGKDGAIGPLPTAELARYLGVKSFNVTGELQDRAEWEANRRKWEYQQWPITLRDEIFPVQLEFVEGDLTCRMGIRTGPPLPSTVAWVKNGRLLSQKSLGSGDFPWLSILFVGEIETNNRFDGPARSSANYTIALRALTKLPELMEQAAGRRDIFVFHQLVRYLEALADNQLHGPLCGAVSLHGSKDKVYEALAERSSHWAFGPRQNAEEFVEAVKGLGAVGTAKLFDTLDGSRASLLDLAESYVKRGAIFVAHQRYKNEGLDEAYNLVSEKIGLTIWSDNEIDRLLFKLVAGDAQSARKRIIFQAAKTRFLQRPELKFELPRARYLSSIEVEDPEAQFKVGLAPTSPAEGRIQLHVRYENREVERTVETVPMGYFDVVVNATAVYPNTSFDALEEGAPKFALWSRIKSQCQSVLYSWVRHHGASFENPAKLEGDEDLFWEFFHALYRREPERLGDLVVARGEHGNEITAKLLSTHVRYGKFAFVREGLEIVDELIPGPGKVPVLTVQPGLRVRELLPESTEVIDVSKTAQNLEFLEAAESRFMSKPVSQMKIGEAATIQVEIDSDGFRGRLALLSTSRVAERKMIEIDLFYRKRFVETRRILVPMGNFKAYVESDNFTMDPGWNSVAKGPRQVWPIVRDAAASAVLALCDEWDESPHVLHTRQREMILGFLKSAILDSEGVRTRWTKVCERLETTQIFRMADSSWKDYRYLRELQERLGGPRWIDNHDVVGTSWKGVDPTTVVVVEDGMYDVISSLSMLTWKHAKDVSKSVRAESPTFSWGVEGSMNAPGQFEVPKELLEGIPAPSGLSAAEPMHELGARLSETLLSVREDRNVLLGDAVISNVTLEAFDESRIARVEPTSITLNENHPVVKHALANPDDPVALSFLGSSVFTAINVFYREITDDHEFEFQMRYARWMRSVLNL